MRKQKKSLSCAKAIAGILFFLGVDCIALVLFESSLLATSLIAYGAVVTASDRFLPSLFAFMAIMLVTFVKGGNCLLVGGYGLAFWFLVTALRKYLWYSWPVRFFLVSLLLILCELGWSLVKIILNVLWIWAGITLFI